jgi:hypothetical protein
MTAPRTAIGRSITTRCRARRRISLFPAPGSAVDSTVWIYSKAGGAGGCGQVRRFVRIERVGQAPLARRARDGLDRWDGDLPQLRA